jgi:hypothetical protein
MFKILCTGNPEHIGIAMEIKKLFPNARFVSRVNGHDLATIEGLDKLRSIVKNYNVFINNAYVAYGIQKTLVSIIREEWQTGHVFNIGSIDEYEKWLPADIGIYEEANSLKNLGLSITDENFKVTHVTVGGFKSSAKPAGLDHNMDPKHIIKEYVYYLALQKSISISSLELVFHTTLSTKVMIQYVLFIIKLI